MYRERIISLAMAPVLLLGTLPHAACICADGHREPSCPTLRQQFVLRTAANTGGATSCCLGKSDEATTSCHAPLGGVAGKIRSCCQPVFEAPAPAIATKKAATPAQSTWVMAHTISSLVPAIDLWPALLPTTQSTPPPLDTVIVFLRLTI